MGRITLVGNGATISFPNGERAGSWLLQQAGIRNLWITKSNGDRWGLCEQLESGSREILVEAAASGGQNISTVLLQKFCEEWAAVLGFAAVTSSPPKPLKSMRVRPGKLLRSYMLDEAAYIATFGY